MKASKTILSILHRGFDKTKQDGRVMVLDQQKIAFENESGTLKDILSSGNRWLAPDAFLRIFGKNSLRIWVSMWINLKVVQKVRFPKREWNK